MWYNDVMAFTQDDKRFIRGLLDEKFDERLEPINNRLDGMGERLDNIEQNMATKDDLSRVEGKIDNLETRTAEGFNKTEKHLKNIYSDTNRIRKDVGKIHEPQAIIVGEHGGRIERLEKQHPDLPPFKSPFKATAVN